MQADVAGRLLDEGERIGEAYGATLDGRSDVKKWNADGMAGARGAADAAVKRGDELRPGSVVFRWR